VLAGQGRCAVITRVVLGLIPVAATFREYVLLYSDVATLLEDQAVLLHDDRFDAVVAQIAPRDHRWASALHAYRALKPSRPPPADLTSGLRHIAGEERTREVSYMEYADPIAELPIAKPQADLGLIIPGSGAPQFIADMLPRLTPEDLGGVTGMRAFFLQRDLFHRPLLRLPAEETFVYLGLLRAGSDDAQVLARALAGNRRLFEMNRARGGTLYPFCALELRPSEWVQLYGAAWQPWADAKCRYDPADVFASGPAMA
jgi:FAD/FMN-containing dehydrogenase